MIARHSPCSLIVSSVLALLAISLSPAEAPGESSKSPLLIVAPDAFHEPLVDYLRFKQERRPVELVSLEKILQETPGRDDPERVKRFLFEQWKAGKGTNALLVGDADVFPVRYMVLDRVTPAAFDYAFYPSDLYYADLAREDGTFDDWNAQQDGFHAGYFGEVRGEKNKTDPINYDRVDYRPDIAVGRWPVSNVDELQKVVAKSMLFERGVLAKDRVGLKAAALFSVGGWVDSRGLMDEIARRMPSDWNVEKRYYRDRRRDDETAPPDEGQLVELLNSGQRIVFHAGHGQDDAWEQCFSVRSLEKLKNADRLPVMISAGCSTARLATLPPYEAYVDVDGKEHAGTNFGEVFDAPPAPPAPYQRGRFNTTGLGEKLLRNGPMGAVAYIGCNTGSQPCGLTLLDGFSQSMREHPDNSLGDCWVDAVKHYYDHEHLGTIVPNNDWYPASIFFQGMKFMLYGDPTLPLGNVD
ncbi:MAG TPA: C25 family cysteine peptidase [Pirellulales bacterium]|nr:C25 family cysteine peptidase [Pirellulales bacterium]